MHFEQRDLSFAAISRAPLAKIEAFQRRMGWKFPWVSSADSDFNFDYQVSFTAQEVESGKMYYNYGTTRIPIEELPGASVFARGKDGQVYHTYSTYARGLDLLLGTFNFMDLTPKGRDEGEEIMGWIRHHDRYADTAASHCGCAAEAAS
jgi:predicted dithiol-disulfide oxidoreductase (DUF899 family)